MAWRVATVVDERRELVKRVLVDEEGVTAVSRGMGVSRQTAYKWLLRARVEGEAGLVDRSRRPRMSPRRTPAEIEERVCGLRRLHPYWGGRKLHHRLLALGLEGVPSPSAITDILARNGLLHADRRLKRDWQRFEAERPNQMWQMDFKGDFPLAAAGRCYTLTLLDDHSRFNVCLKACADQRRETVQDQLLPVFATYGLPEALLVDNGPPWGSGYSRWPHTRFTAWLMALGIYVSHGRPYHPQTRGKDERFHRSLGREVLTMRRWEDLAEVQLALDTWRVIYNQERPHQALNYKVPAEAYVASFRPLPDKAPAPAYLSTDEIRRVQGQGEISFRGHLVHIGRAFSGDPVALRATEEDGVWSVHYYKQRVGMVDLRSPLPMDV
jgi:transposase InsO family protein